MGGQLRFSIRALLVAVCACAIMFSLYGFLPTFTLSILLLAPLPIIGIALSIRATRQRWRSLLWLALPAVFALYVGLSGPMTAFVLMPDDWGMSELQLACLAVGGHAYPNAMYDSIGRMASVMI